MYLPMADTYRGPLRELGNSCIFLLLVRSRFSSLIKNILRSPPFDDFLIKIHFPPSKWGPLFNCSTLLISASQKSSVNSTIHFFNRPECILLSTKRREKCSEKRMNTLVHVRPSVNEPWTNYPIVPPTLTPGFCLMHWPINIKRAFWPNQPKIVPELRIHWWPTKCPLFHKDTGKTATNCKAKFRISCTYSYAIVCPPNLPRGASKKKSEWPP